MTKYLRLSNRLVNVGVGMKAQRLAHDLLKGLARTTQDGTYINLYACDLDLALWRGLFHWFRAFVIAATPGNGNEVWHTAKCR